MNNLHVIETHLHKSLKTNRNLPQWLDFYLIWNERLTATVPFVPSEAQEGNNWNWLGMTKYIGKINTYEKQKLYIYIYIILVLTHKSCKEKKIIWHQKC